MEFVTDFRGDGSYDGPQFRGWQVNMWLETWKGILPQPDLLHTNLFYFIYKIDLMMEVCQSDGTIPSRE